jgi:hypothetical protein
MKKKHYVATSIILTFLLLMTLDTAIPSVKAYEYGYGHGSDLFTTNWREIQSNAQYTSDAFDFIAGRFAAPQIYVWNEWCGYYPIGPSWGRVENHGDATYWSTVSSSISYDLSYHSDFSAVLYIGHGTQDAFYEHGDNDNVQPDLDYYNDIHNLNLYSSTYRLAFMWVCSGDNYPYSSEYAWNPLALSDPNTYGPFTWIGFHDESPWLTESMNSGNIYKNWLIFFYYFATIPGNSISDALNIASYYTGFGYYSACILNTGFYTWNPWPPGELPNNQTGRMVILGHPEYTILPLDEYYS